MRAVLLGLILALLCVASHGINLERLVQRQTGPVIPKPKLVIDRSAPRVERFSGKRVLEDVEMMEQRLTPVAFYQSTYLNCTDDSECCPKSRCAWPLKAVRGTTDHKTCIMNNIGNIAAEVWCPPCTPAGAKYTNGKCDPSTAPKPAPLPTPSKPSNSSEPDKKDSQPSGTDTDPEADAEANEEGGSQPRPRLPEANVIGEAPPTLLDSDSVDQVARWALLQRLQTKCDGLDEWCRDQLDGADAVSSSSASSSSSGSWSNSLSPLSSSSDSLSSSMSFKELNDINQLENLRV